MDMLIKIGRATHGRVECVQLVTRRGAGKSKYSKGLGAVRQSLVSHDFPGAF